LRSKLRIDDAQFRQVLDPARPRHAMLIDGVLPVFQPT